jgi:C-terminal processing protease CtpA/Prc
MRVESLLPGCAAEKSGNIQVGDEIVAVDGEEGLDGARARARILGRQGTYSTITFRRFETSHVRTFKVQLMRGTSDYIFLVECLRSMEARPAAP